MNLKKGPHTSPFDAAMPPGQSSNSYALLSDCAASPGSAVADNQSSRSADSTPLKRPQRRRAKASSLQHGVQPAASSDQPANGAAPHAEGSAGNDGVSGMVGNGHARDGSRRMAHQQSADPHPSSFTADATDTVNDTMVSATCVQPAAVRVAQVAHARAAN